MEEANKKERKVAVYGRVSTEHEAQISAFDNQVLWYELQVEKHPEWTVVDRYFDKGITGTQAKKRPSFLRMIEDAKKGRFDLIITREVSRFARNTLDTLQYTRMLTSIGVEVFFINDGISTFNKDGEHELTMMASFAQKGSKIISRAVIEGQTSARLKKKVLYGTGNILGYNRSGDTFVIDEEQAETVRMIFRLYLEGKGIRTIKLGLTKTGRKNSAGQVKWYESTIGRILDNPMYIGKQYQKQTTVIDCLEHKREKNEKSDYVVIEGNFEPIISANTFEKVAEIKGENSQKFAGLKARGIKRSTDKWMNLMECNCGARFQQYNWRRSKDTGEIARGYACRNRTLNNTTKYRLANGLPIEGACDRKSISEWYLDLMVKDIIEEVWVLRKESVLQAFELTRDCFIDDEVDNGNKVKELQLKIDRNKQKISRLIDLYTDESIDKKQLDEKRKQYDEIIKASKEEAERISGGLGLAEKNLETKLIHIRDTLQQLVDFDKERLDEGIINQLVEKVIVRGDNEFEWLINLSDIQTNDLFSFYLNEKYEVKRAKSIEVRDSKYTLAFNSVISVERAQEYRKKYGKHIKPGRWHDINYSVYVR
ncbi:recombinase family protein [Desulfosporosinus burensis]